MARTTKSISTTLGLAVVVVEAVKMVAAHGPRACLVDLVVPKCAAVCVQA